MKKQKFTVVWGNIGDGHERRLDHVEAEPNLEAIMLAAKRLAYEDIETTENDDLTFEVFCDQMYDGYAIFEGHIFEKTGLSFW